MSIADNIATELMAIQAEAALYLPQSCIIEREVKATDGYGHDKPSSWTTLNGGAVRCGLSKNLGRMAQIIGGELTSLNQWLLQVPVKVTVNGVLTPTDIKIDDQVTVGSTTLLVQNIGKEQGNPLVLEVVVAEFEGAG